MWRGGLMTNSEQRDATRVNHKANILLENFTAGAHHKATMFNYSRGGMYFESDRPGGSIRTAVVGVAVVAVAS